MQKRNLISEKVIRTYNTHCRKKSKGKRECGILCVFHKSYKPYVVTLRLPDQCFVKTSSFIPAVNRHSLFIDVISTPVALLTVDQRCVCSHNIILIFICKLFFGHCVNLAVSAVIGFSFVVLIGLSLLRRLRPHQ